MDNIENIHYVQQYDESESTNVTTTEDIIPENEWEGALLLGSRESDEVYRTRYCVDHGKQRSNLCQEVLHEEWFPFCARKHRSHVYVTLLAFIRSEVLLFSLHMLTIVLGVIKQEVSNVKEDKILHMVHSVIETFVTLFLISIRTSSAWRGYRKYKRSVYHSKVIIDKEAIKGRSLKRWLLLYTAFAAFLGLLSWGGFVGFYFNDLDGWTILTNQFCLISILAMSDLYLASVELATIRLREDEFKVIIYESQLINMDLVSAQSTNEISAQQSQAQKFSRALANTPFLRRPSYITNQEANNFRTKDIKAWFKQVSTAPHEVTVL